MSNRNFDAGLVIGKRIVDLVGSFVPLTGAGTIVAANVKGLGFGFAPGSTGTMTLQPNVSSKSFLTTTPGILRTGTGLYTVTFEDPFIDVDGLSADLAVPAGGSALWIQPIEPIANLGSSTAAPVASLQIINAAGAPTDAGANSRVHFFIRFRDSTVQRNKP